MTPKGSSFPDRVSARPRFFYGWVIVFISALTLFFSGPGQTYSVSTFIDSYIAEFGWSRSLVSSMYSMGTLIAGFVIAGVGSFFDRFGHRSMTTIVAALFGLALLGMSFVNSLAALFIGFFFIRLLGQGSMTLASSTLVPQWFISKRGRALSLVSLAGALSAALLPPLNTWLIQSFGWRMGWRTWAVLLWAIMAPIAYFAIRNKPEDVGLLPDNKQRAKDVTAIDELSVADDIEESFTVKEALRTKSFWLLLFCSTIPSAIGTGLTFHQVSIMGEVGLSASVAASVLSAMALIRLPVIFATGQIADRIPVRYLIAVALGGLLVAMVILLNTTTLYMALAYGVLRGMTMGVQSITGGVVWPNYFGRKNLGSIRGFAMTAMVIGSAFGPLPFGVAYDFFGDTQK